MFLQTSIHVSLPIHGTHNSLNTLVCKISYILTLQLFSYMQQTKRKDNNNNNILETFLKQFKEKDFNKNFKSIDRELFKLIKDEAHIYLSDGDKTKIINYFKYLRIHYECLKQNLQN